MKFCFVILHYKIADDTIECLESINRLKDDCNIVIVDNASNNGSIEKVEEVYGLQMNVTIIKNKENLGFASGNNVGYQYARDVLKADFIAVSNNDILVDTSDFIKRVADLFDSTEFYVAGPDIESLIDHKHQSPMNAPLSGVQEIKKEIWRYRILYFLSRLQVYELLKGKAGKRNDLQEEQIEIKTEREGVALHGAFVIFSPAFVKREEYSFRPGTFLYMEEAILYDYCTRKNYKMVYTPGVKVYHKEDASTNSLFNAAKSKREFVFINMIRSLKVYCNEIKNVHKM